MSREEDKLRELLDYLESALLTFSLARFSMVPAKGQHKQHPKETRIKKRVSVSHSCWGIKPPQMFVDQRAMILFEGEIFFCVFLVYELH